MDPQYTSKIKQINGLSCSEISIGHYSADSTQLMPLKDIDNRCRVTLRNEGQTCWLNASLVILIHTDYYDHYLYSVDIEKLEHQEVGQLKRLYQNQKQS